MAGVYPDIPATRFALDQDGSVLKWRNISSGSGWTDITGQIATVQDAGNDDYFTLTTNVDQVWELALAFPEPRTLNAMFLALSAVESGSYPSPTFYYSTDTTDGTDGSWTPFTGPTRRVSEGTLKPYYRDSIGSFGPLANVTGFRWRQQFNNGLNQDANNRIYAMHVYGTRPTASVDRLGFWDPSSDQAINAAALDFGDHPQGTTTTRQFRIKNLSSTQTATSIDIAVDDLDNEFNGNLELSTDDTTYLPSINIGDLGPGVISSTLYVKRTVPGSETPTQRAARLLANASSWS